MSGLSANTVYRLRIALSQPNSSNYFGSTYDGTNWHYGSISSNNFVSVTTNNNGSWSGDIQGKVDPQDPDFTTGSGTYDLKVGRYTLTGTSSTWSDPVSITIYAPPAPSPTPTFVSTATPTLTPAPTKKLIKTLTPTLHKTPTPTESSDVLGAGTSAITRKQSIVTPTVIVEDVKKDIFNFYPIAILVGSLLFLGGGVFLFFKMEKPQKDV